MTSTATRVAPGTSSRRSSSRFAANSVVKKLTPVRLPPGRARLATDSSLTGSSGDEEDDRDRRGCGLGSQCRCGTSARGNHEDLSTNQISRQLGQPMVLALRPTVHDYHVLAFDIASVLQTQAECAQTVRGSCQATWCRGIRSPASPAAARARRQRPRRRRAGEQRDELAPLHLRTHSVTSSARSRNCSTPNHLNIHVLERDYDIKPRFSALIGFVLHGYPHNDLRILRASSPIRAQ